MTSLKKKRDSRNILPWEWIERFAAHKQIIGLFIALLIFAAALVVCWRLLKEINVDDLSQAIHDIPLFSLLLALAASAGSYVMLICYEWSAARYAGAKLRLPTLIMGGACASAVGNAVGLSILSGGAVRFRLYFNQGLGATQVARMSVFVALSLGVALPLLAAVAALNNIEASALALRIPVSWVIAIALSILVVYLAVLVFLLLHRLPRKPNPDTCLFQVGKWLIRLPSVRLALLQFFIIVGDVFFAASILYVLLPETPSFISFLLVYILALVIGVISHVPGGVGVFEAIVLAAFSSQIGAIPLAAALLIYRVIYVLLPLVLACCAMLVHEGKSYLSTSFVAQSGLSVAAPVLSAAVFFSGIILLFSGMSPEVDTHLETLGFFLPQQLINASHFAASLIGVLCFFLARGLRRRLSIAWTFTMFLLLLASVLSLLKGLRWVEALTLLMIAALLLVFKKSFYRHRRLMSMPLSPLFLAVCFCIVVTSIWIMLFVYQDVPYNNKLWWQFELDSNVPRALRAAVGSLVLLGCLALTWLFKHPSPTFTRPDRQQLDKALHIVSHGTQAQAGLVMSGDKSILFNEESSAFLMYACHKRSMVALFDPVGSEQERADLIWDFRDLCDQHHMRPVFYQVRSANLPYYIDIGLRAIKIGEEALIDLEGFNLESTSKRDLRYTWNRGQRDGLSLTIFPAGEAPMERLKEISDSWLKNKHLHEKGFSLGHFSADYLRHFKMAAIYHEGNIIAFASLLETESKASASIDLMRVTHHVPKLTMEFLMIGLILHYKQENYRTFSLGMAPLSGLQSCPETSVIQRLGDMIYRRGERFYNFQGLRLFKDKFGPRWEPHYIAAPGGLDLLVALVDITVLIAGGFRKLVKY